MNDEDDAKTQLMEEPNLKSIADGTVLSNKFDIRDTPF